MGLFIVRQIRSLDLEKTSTKNVIRSYNSQGILCSYVKDI